MFEELFDWRAPALRFRSTNLVNIIFGGVVYPSPCSVTVIDVIDPWSTVATAFAPIPPPPLIKINGASW